MRTSFSRKQMLPNIMLAYLLLLSSTLLAQNTKKTINESLVSQSYNIAFSKGKATLSLKAIEVLDKVVAQKSPFYEVIGYADSKGDELKNLSLSQERATAVADYLKVHGIPARTIDIAAFGEKHPLTDAQARKVAIVLHKNIITSWKKMEKKPDFFMLTPNHDTTLVGKEGTKITIPAGTFEGVQPVKITLKEFYSRFDMWLNGMTTQSDTSLLETAGMLFLVAEQGGKLVKPKKEVSLSFATSKTNGDGFYLYNGVIDKEGKLNWKLDLNSVTKKTTKPELDFTGQLPHSMLDDTKMIQTSIIKDESQAFGINYDIIVEPENLSKNRTKQILGAALQEKSGLPLAEVANFKRGVCTAILDETGRFNSIKVSMNSPFLEATIKDVLNNTRIKPRGSNGEGLPEKPLNIEIVFSAAPIIANRTKFLTAYCSAHPSDSLAAQKLRVLNSRKVFNYQAYEDSLRNARIDKLSEKGDAQGIIKEVFKYNTSRLGFTNLDRPYIRAKNLAPLYAFSTDSAAVSITLISKGTALFVIKNKSDTNKKTPQEIVFKRAPQEEAAWVIAAKEENGRAYFALSETVINTKKPIRSLIFEVATPEKLKKLALLLE